MAKQNPILGVEVLGTGGASGSLSYTNDELIELTGIDSSHAWISERTGILSRHFNAFGVENTLTLSVKAATQALQAAGLEAPYHIDRTILATTTSYLRVPGTHPDLLESLPIVGGAGREEASSKEINTACTGFVTATIEGFRGFPTDGDELDLIVGADSLTEITDREDRGTVILFADGGGAVVLGRSERPDAGLLGWYEMTDGSARPALYCALGDESYIQMQGTEVFKRATKVMVTAGATAVERAGLKIEEIDLVIPHQANSRIIEYAAHKLKVDMEKVMVTIDHHGNTSSGSIPLALDEAVRGGRVERGQNILLVGFGAGMTAAAAVIRW